MVTTPTTIEPPGPGRYAVYLPENPTKLRFFIMTKIRFVEQAGPNYFPVANRRSKEAIFLAIQENPLEAMARYGKELGYCGKCGRELTDETSRALGIGPKCGGRI